MKKEMITALAVQVAVTLGIVGAFALMGIAGVGMLVGVGYICVSSENLRNKYKDQFNK